MQRTNLNVSFGKDEVSLYNEMIRVGSLTYTPVAPLTRKYLGEGYGYEKAKKEFMPNDTVEGADLVLELGPKILKDF